MSSSDKAPPKKKNRMLLFLLILGLIVLIYTQITIFVIQPLGMLPEGKTVVILRLGGDKFSTKFIDSADAICERIQGGVNLLCRMGVLGGIGENATIIMRLPYSQTLYEISTGGKVYDR